MSAVVYELADGVISLDFIFRDSELLRERQNLYAENYTGAMSGSVSLMLHLVFFISQQARTRRDYLQFI